MSDAVQRMFASIAKRYDLANDVLSFGVHHIWRKKAVRALGLHKDAVVLDLCTGTGDVALEIQRQLGNGVQVIGVDFVPEMLALAREKAKSRGADNLVFVQGDAMNLELGPESVEGATIAFGIRNVDDPLVCLRGIRRVMKSRAKVAILEFGQPENRVFGAIYWTYARYLLPLIGSCITGNREAYEYLPRTSKAFPSGKEFSHLLREAGFVDEKHQPLFGGIAYLYTATAPAA